MRICAVLFYLLFPCLINGLCPLCRSLFLITSNICHWAQSKNPNTNIIKPKSKVWNIVTSFNHHPVTVSSLFYLRPWILCTHFNSSFVLGHKNIRIYPVGKLLRLKYNIAYVITACIETLFTGGWTINSETSWGDERWISISYGTFLAALANGNFAQYQCCVCVLTPCILLWRN